MPKMRTSSVHDQLAGWVQTGITSHHHMTLREIAFANLRCKRLFANEGRMKIHWCGDFRESKEDRQLRSHQKMYIPWVSYIGRNKKWRGGKNWQIGTLPLICWRTKPLLWSPIQLTMTREFLSMSERQLEVEDMIEIRKTVSHGWRNSRLQ